MLPVSASRLPLEVQQNIDLQSYRLQQISQGKIVLERGTKEVQPMQTKDRAFLVVEELEPLSKIISELNTRFGTDFNEDDKVCILAIEERLSKREDLMDSLRVNKPDDAMLTFNHALTEVLNLWSTHTSELQTRNR
jgi:type I restriction enzyme R subunit